MVHQTVVYSRTVLPVRQAHVAVRVGSAVPAENIVLRSANQRVLIESMLAGVSIGFMPVVEATRVEELYRIMPPRADWSVPLWLIPHVDLHRTSNLKAILWALVEVAEEVGAALP